MLIDTAFGVVDCDCEDRRRNPRQTCKHGHAAVMLRNDMLANRGAA